MKEDNNAKLTKSIELPPIITASDLIQAQVNNRVPEPKIKRGIKRDYLIQQTIKSFAIPTTSTLISDNDECVMKKPKIGNTDSDMEISSDDEVQIIENTNIDDSKISGPPIIVEDLTLHEENNDVSNLECNIPKPSYYQKTSITNNLQQPKIVIASNLLKKNCESFDLTKNSINVESDNVVQDNVIFTYQDRQLFNNSNNSCTDSKINVIDDENDTGYCQSINNRIPQKSEETSESDIFNEVSNFLRNVSENGKKLTKQQKEPSLDQKQNDLKRPSIEHRLSNQQNIEVSLPKSNMDNLFGDDSDDESKIPLTDTKKKSLGVRLGMPSNVNTFNANKKSNEVIKTIKNKTEDQPNNKNKKFVLSNLVVKILNPYYVKKTIITKALFKFMAREIVHKLLESTNYPGKYVFVCIYNNK